MSLCLLDVKVKSTSPVTDSEHAVSGFAVVPCFRLLLRDFTASSLADDKFVTASSLMSAGSKGLGGNRAASVGVLQSTPKSRKDGFSPVASCSMFL